MADFCRQCGIEHLGADYRDLADITTVQETDYGIYATVLCEGCGHTQVDHNGRCVSPACFDKHGAK